MGIVRTLLAISVVLAHTPQHGALVSGQLAVQSFYLISGFLIAFVLTNTKSYESPKAFWLNRALRLYPAYCVVLALAAVRALATWWERDTGPIALFLEASAAVKAFLIATHAALFGQDWTMFVGFRPDGVAFEPALANAARPFSDALLVPPAWTLGLELTFYAIAPFIVGRTRLLFALLMLSLAARGVACLLGYGAVDPWTYRFFPFELSLFIGGMLCHQFLLAPVRAFVSKQRSAVLVPTVTAAVIALCIAYPLLPAHGSLKTPAFLALFVCALPFLFVFQERSRIDRVIGDLSYPIYIGHVLVIVTLESVLKRVAPVVHAEWFPHGSTALTALNVLGAIAFGIILKIAVTDPVEKIRTRLRRKRSELPPMAALVERKA